MILVFSIHSATEMSGVVKEQIRWSMLKRGHGATRNCRPKPVIDHDRPDIQSPQRWNDVACGFLSFKDANEFPAPLSRSGFPNKNKRRIQGVNPHVAPMYVRFPFSYASYLALASFLSYLHTYVRGRSIRKLLCEIHDSRSASDIILIPWRKNTCVKNIKARI